MNPDRAYFDHSATTPVDPGVLERMIPYFSEEFGNPSSVHVFGQRAEAAISEARSTIAGALGSQPGEIVFTANGTESDNIALRGTAKAARAKRGANHLLISPVEHEAIHKTAALLQEEGFDLEFLPVDSFGRVSPDTVADRIRPDTALVSIMYANNEVGTLNSIASIGRICNSADVPLHTDAVQAATYLSLDVDHLGVDTLALSAHKFYGPKGIGVLFHRRGTPLGPLLAGGDQEHGMRPGTENTPFIVGAAYALTLASEKRDREVPRLIALRDRLIEGVLEGVPDARLTGHPSERLPNHASFVFPGIDGNQLLAALDLEGFACSSGSACKTGDPEPSRVLRQLGFGDSLALGALRVTLGRSNTIGQVDRFLDVLPTVIARLRLQRQPTS